MSKRREPGARPRILITNDDGIDARTLPVLRAALAIVGEVVVVAPERNWSASGHVKTMHKPLRLTETTLVDGSDAYAASGAPSDCVALVILGALERKPDLVISGINVGANLGHDVTYSGTVTAAMEAVIFGVPGLAVSLDTAKPPEPRVIEHAAAFTAGLAAQVLKHGLPKHTLLNVNIPNLPGEEIRGVQITKQGQRVYRDVLDRREDPRGRAYYWIGGEAPSGVAEPGTDIGALADGYISITPLQLDLTHYAFIDEMKKWGLEAFGKTEGPTHR